MGDITADPLDARRRALTYGALRRNRLAARLACPVPLEVATYDCEMVHTDQHRLRAVLDAAIAVTSELSLEAALESPRRLSDDVECARRLVRLVPEVPTPTWGRDELGVGEMWNSNSPISWLITRGGLHSGRGRRSCAGASSRLASRHRDRAPQPTGSSSGSRR
jgi:hypothetical protein